MAITSNQAEQVAAQPNFLQRVEFQLTLMAENIASEATSTNRHAQRAALASQVLNSPAQYAQNWAPAIVSQLPLTTTNMVGTTDVDTTDAALGTIISSIWNDFLPAGF